jgi:hypothetical protein
MHSDFDCGFSTIGRECGGFPNKGFTKPLSLSESMSAELLSRLPAERQQSPGKPVSSSQFKAALKDFTVTY